MSTTSLNTPLPSYTLKNVTVAPGLILAPMSGVTARPFRRLLKELNPGHVGLVVTEFISVEALTRNVPRSLEMLRTCDSEYPFSIQIFGWDIQRMCDAARMAQDAGADIVDINCGCPAPKVVRRGGGCELMRQPEHLQEIVKAVRKVVTVPLTLKMRSGWDEEHKNCVELAQMLEGEGIEALGVHGRTKAQMYRGFSDWDWIRRVANAVKIPVLGSGDVVDRPSAEERLRINPEIGPRGVSGLMIGRASYTNPFVFSDIVLDQHTNFRTNPKLALSVLKRYIELLEEDFGPKVIPGRIKQLASNICRGIGGSDGKAQANWRMKLLLANSAEAQKEALSFWEDSLQVEENAAPDSAPVSTLSESEAKPDHAESAHV